MNLSDEQLEVKTTQARKTLKRLRKETTLAMEEHKNLVEEMDKRRGSKK